MVDVILQRISQTSTETFGVIILNHNPICFTLERPWLNNQEDVSCIPSGIYQCIKHDGVEFKNVWEITNVKNRFGVLMHNGNTVENTKGCILVGRQAGPHSVSLSVMALDDLRKLLPDNFTLIIKDVVL